MGLKADAPDFIDSGSYDVTDVSGWGKNALGLAVGTGIATVAVVSGMRGGRSAQTWLSNAIGGASDASSGNDNMFDF